MARNPIYPTSAGETAVDRLLNQTLPRIIADKQASNERKEMRAEDLTQRGIENQQASDEFEFRKTEAQDKRTKDEKDGHFNNASVILEQAELINDPEQKAKLLEKAGEKLLLSGRNPSDYGIGATGAITLQVSDTIDAEKLYAGYKIHLDPTTNGSSTSKEYTDSYLAASLLKSKLGEKSQTEFGNFVTDNTTTDDTRYDIHRKPEFSGATIDAIQSSVESSEIRTDFSRVPPGKIKEITDSINANRVMGTASYLIEPTQEDIENFYQQNYDPAKLTEDASKLHLGEIYEVLDTQKERLAYYGALPIDQSAMQARDVIKALSATKRSGTFTMEKQDDGSEIRFDDPLEGEALRKAASEFGIPDKVLLQIEDEFEVSEAPVVKVLTKEEKVTAKNNKSNQEKDRKNIVSNNQLRSYVVREGSPNYQSNPQFQQIGANIQRNIDEYNIKHPGNKVDFEEVINEYKESVKR